MSELTLDLYIKPGCPWCSKATAWLDERGFRYESHDVIADPDKFAEMEELTGQTYAPNLRVRSAGCDDLVLADFGPEELEAFVAEHGLSP